MESVVIDANVFFRLWVLDPILTLADEGMFQPLWSTMIMEEAERHLPEVWQNSTSEAIDSFLDTVNRAYPWAQVPDWRGYMDGLTLPDPDDRHVLAAAIAGEATTIVTMNLADFPTTELSRHNITAEHPDTFLTRLYDSDCETVTAAMHHMTQRKQHPPRTMKEEIQGLREAGLTTFADRISKKS
ncbi:PIN domain-containing protein [Bifidobacterium sp. ESL0728]|uniref:PIN domain-containing protein n=1 Tax=Bifidobacterium sp. ESL0728 TaxID=2983220 RepID=UPI0023F960F6|nr:PIN domain-containing protein [Bifidobacterium sp. ESL0728]WEV59478.1 PIN domain-containing protein [Bifidobacterium sp. ESL0728]